MRNRTRTRTTAKTKRITRATATIAPRKSPRARIEAQPATRSHECPPAPQSVRFARDLFRIAARVMPLFAADDNAPALLAIDAFVAAPGPASYLRAVRLLRDARRGARSATLNDAFAARSFAHGMKTFAALPFVEPEQLANFQALEKEPGAGRRLSALALLLSAHQELAARVRHSEAARPPFVPLPTREKPKRQRRND